MPVGIIISLFGTLIPSSVSIGVLAGVNSRAVSKVVCAQPLVCCKEACVCVCVCMLNMKMTDRAHMNAKATKILVHFTWGLSSKMICLWTSSWKLDTTNASE